LTGQGGARSYSPARAFRTRAVLIRLDTEGGRLSIAKTATTAADQSPGVLGAMAQASVRPGEADLIVHGTTTATNAILERKLSRTGLITTAGFRDVPELGRRTRPQAYGMKGHFVPIIPQDLRVEIPERMDAAGDVVVPLDEAAPRRAAELLLERGCEALVIHFLHAYANPSHDLRAAEIASTVWPNGFITTGHSLLSESREFGRGVTAAVNASMQPLLKRYLKRLRERLAADGYCGERLVMNGNGGMTSSRLVSREAAKTVMSGPASGVMARRPAPAVWRGRRTSSPTIWAAPPRMWR